MWHHVVAVLALCQSFHLLRVQAAPTWPDSIDEIEDLMMLQSGYRARSFASPVIPCTNSPIQGFRFAAGFVRVAFHDSIAYDAASGTNGLDGSIGFELEGTYAVHNTGPSFNATMVYLSEYYNSKASIADMIALGLYASVRSCGGPQIAMKAGRIDATQAGPDALPDAADSRQVLLGRFAKMGFSPTEMIQLVACGHTLGGVHPGQNPPVTQQNPQVAQAQGVLTFDTTDAEFDNRVASEYIQGTTRNPLVVGPPQLASDARVFSTDNNVTIGAMAASNDAYQGMCQQVLEKMLECVPSNVQLSSVIQAYDVKPGQLNLNVINDGSALLFSGEIRIRTTDLSKSNIAKVQLVYKDRSGGACQGCTIDAQAAGDAFGFDDSFTFYGFSAAVKSISSFNVVITTTSGQARAYTNNGNGFQVNDGAFVQTSSSSLSGSALNVVVAVRSGQQGTPQMSLSVRSAHVFNTLPTLSQISLSVTKICGDDAFTYYSGTANVDPSQAGSAKLDVSLGGNVVDGFRSINFASSGVTPTCGGNSVSTTTTTSTTSSSSTTTTTSSSTTTTTTTTSLNTSNSTITTTSYSNSSSTTTTTSSSTTTTTSSSTTTTTTTTSSTKGHGGATTKTTSTSSTSYSVPNWTVWDPLPTAPGATMPGYPLIVTTVVTAITTVCPSPTKLTHNGKTYTVTASTTLVITDCPCTITNTPTASVGQPETSANSAYGLLSSIYSVNYNEPAPSDGTDGGNQNVGGLNLSVSVTIVTPTVTAPTGVANSAGANSWVSTSTPTDTASASSFKGAASHAVIPPHSLIVALTTAGAVLVGALALVL